MKYDAFFTRRDRLVWVGRYTAKDALKFADMNAGERIAFQRVGSTELLTVNKLCVIGL